MAAAKKSGMGMDLDGTKGGNFRWTGSGWRKLRERAEAAGWEPMGTGPPRGVRKADWDGGNYFSNNGQRVYARDAGGLADALESILAELPPEEQDGYKDFIAFCRAGSFRLR